MHLKIITLVAVIVLTGSFISVQTFAGESAKTVKSHKNYYNGDFKSAPIVFKSGNWAVKRTLDAMTDVVTCIALYKSRYQIQLSGESLYIDMRNRGHIKGYRFRIDNNPASEMKFPSVDREIKANNLLAQAISQGPEAAARQRAANDAEAQLSIQLVELTASSGDLTKILEAKRLRVEILPVLGRTLIEDIDLNGVKKAHTFITGDECQ